MIAMKYELVGHQKRLGEKNNKIQITNPMKPEF